MKKVAVIVPVYNVEKYLERCIKSIINQTYKNFVCILVDDGSTDGSGKICDHYHKLDSRIISVHKENSGVSDARNLGLDKLQKEADYIMFVDADDWVSNDAIQVLVNKAEELNADMIVFNYYAAYKNDNIFINTTGKCNFSSEEIKEKLLNDYWLNSPWDKFFKSSLWKDIRFPSGIFFEDAYVMPRLLLQVQNACCISDALYFYNQINTVSISKNFDSVKLHDIMLGWKQRLNLVDELYNGMYRENYIKNIKKFAYESLLLNQIDHKLNGTQLDNIRTISEIQNEKFNRILPYIFKYKYIIKTYIRNRALFYKFWMSIKNKQK